MKRIENVEKIFHIVFSPLFGLEKKQRNRQKREKLRSAVIKGQSKDAYGGHQNTRQLAVEPFKDLGFPFGPWNIEKRGEHG